MDLNAPTTSPIEEVGVRLIVPIAFGPGWMTGAPVASASDLQPRSRNHKDSVQMVRAKPKSVEDNRRAALRQRLPNVLNDLADSFTIAWPSTTRPNKHCLSSTQMVMKYAPPPE